MKANTCTHFNPETKRCALGVSAPQLCYKCWAYHVKNTDNSNSSDGSKD